MADELKRAAQFEQLTKYVECPHCGHSHADDDGWVGSSTPQTELICHDPSCGRRFLVVWDDEDDDDGL